MKALVAFVVTPLSPGATLAPLLTPRSEIKPATYASFQAVQPLKRMAKNSEIAKVAIFLLSDDASFVDRGLHARFA